MTDQPTDALPMHPEEMKGTVEFKLGKLAPSCSNRHHPDVEV